MNPCSASWETVITKNISFYMRMAGDRRYVIDNNDATLVTTVTDKDETALCGHENLSTITGTILSHGSYQVHCFC